MSSKSTNTLSSDRMNLVVVGHVDHGKSTVVGRLLADTDSLPEGKLERVRQQCERSGKRLEYAFLLDALSDEQDQGITIDVARIFFNSKDRQYIIIDAPGHIEFLKNMITGASHAEAAVLVIDADEGIKENSLRHGYMLSLLGVESVIVLVNKMDLVGYDQASFERLRSEYEKYLKSVGISAKNFIPVSGIEGEGIASFSNKLSWFKGPTLLAALDALPRRGLEEKEALRMFVQDVYKFTEGGDDRRIVAGTIDSGTIRVGDPLVFFPSGKRSRVKSIEAFAEDPPSARSRGEAVGITLDEQIFVRRGELITRAEDPRPFVSSKFRCSLFWLGETPMVTNREYILRVGTARVTVRLARIERLIDAGSLSQDASGEDVARNMVAECVMQTTSAVAFDPISFSQSSARFVIVDDFRICGGGIIREGIEDAQSALRQQAYRREEKWIHSSVSASERAERFGQRPVLVLVTGEPQADRKQFGKALEAHLFSEGAMTYFMGIGNIIYGLDSDIEGAESADKEHIRRLAEVANMMLNAGLIFVVSAALISQADIQLIRQFVGVSRVRSVWLGDAVTNDLQCDALVDSIESGVEEVRAMLLQDGFLDA